jgi:RHS repeat-associated protein
VTAQVTGAHGGQSGGDAQHGQRDRWAEEGEQEVAQAAVITNYAYDATGNLTCRPNGGAANTCPPGTNSQTLAWDPEGRLSTNSNNNQVNIYDADGTRLIRRDSTGTTLYLPGQEIRRQGSTTTATRYYDFAGKTVASRTPSALTWLYTDHQGTQHTTGGAANQQAVTTRRQTPYGGPRGAQPVWPNPKGFVGGDNDPTGLTHLGAREYDPGLGRFISVDPVQDLTDPQQWHGYSYANNSPITLSDPSGLSPEDAQWEAKHPGAPNKAAKDLGWNKYGCPDGDCSARDKDGRPARIDVYTGKNGTIVAFDLDGNFYLDGYRLPPADFSVIKLASIVDAGRADGRMPDADSPDALARLWTLLTEIVGACSDIKVCANENNLFIWL